MHKLTLVQSEVQLMRGGLDTLSKRRRAKKKRLRQGGSMSVAEAEDVQAQNGAQALMKQKGQQDSVGVSPLRRAHRRCGTCGNVGHDSRTCQIIVAT